MATLELLHQLLCTNMGYTDFDCTHLYLEMLSFTQLRVTFSVKVQLIDPEPIQDDVMHELVMNAIHAHILLQW